MNFREHKDCFRFVIFYAPELITSNSLVASLLTADQYALVEHINSEAAFDTECKSWPRAHYHGLFYSESRPRGIEHSLRKWVRGLTNCHIKIFKCSNPVRSFNKLILDANTATGAVQKRGIVFEKYLLEVNVNLYGRTNLLQDVWEYEKIGDSDETVLLAQRIKKLMESGKPFCKSIENILAILETSGGFLRLDEHSLKMDFAVQCTEYVCFCFECMEEQYEQHT